MGEKCIAAALHASVSVFGKMLGALNRPMPWWQADRFPFVPNVNANTDRWVQIWFGQYRSSHPPLLSKSLLLSAPLRERVQYQFQPMGGIVWPVIVQKKSHVGKAHFSAPWLILPLSKCSKLCTKCVPRLTFHFPSSRKLPLPSRKLCPFSEFFLMCLFSLRLT